MKKSPGKTSRGGRPSRQEAERIGERILDAATGLFFAQGYGAPSIEAVAAKARVSKRTFYDRFDDKADLFRAVMRRVVEKLRPAHAENLLEGGSCEEILHRIAPVILHAALMPDALALHRLMLAEAARFPELAAAAHGPGGRQEAVRLIAALLRKEAETGCFAVEKPEFAAEQFLQMLVSSPQRRALGLGKPMTPAEIKAWARDTVDLFLNGCRS